ncbi:hypothetical protein L1987_51203 [Smallanthus sonchifolius]|uniref:Uncharacterized protein n=1 Tax=Smallanthus sonchifolius TaxID=185202 RepID=A0ACB9EPL9_9ASTR|nr:hypothetical protein L1987_51203 [Smallanthus sonchifolius]
MLAGAGLLWNVLFLRFYEEIHCAGTKTYALSLLYRIRLGLTILSPPISTALSPEQSIVTSDKLSYPKR